jgi:hypothetical protein
MVAYYAEDENFQRLVTGEDGKNLSQSYEADVISSCMPDLAACIFYNAGELIAAQDAGSDLKAKLDAVCRYCAARTHNLFGPDRADTTPEDEFAYDIDAWLNDPELRPLEYFALGASRRVRFVLSPTQYREVENALDTFGHNAAGQAKALIRIRPGVLYRNAVSEPA